MLLTTGCRDSGGRTIQHGSVRYSAIEIFGDGTKECRLAAAAARADLRAIDSEIREGARVNGVGAHGITPLWWADWAGNYDGFAALLDQGGDPNVQPADTHTVIWLAADQEDSRFLQAVLKHGGNPNLQDRSSGETPLFRAVLRGFRTNVDLLLGAGADVNARQPITQQTLPMLAIGVRADYELVFLFLQKGADPMATTPYGQTLASTIEMRSINSNNNDDPWRKKVIDYLRTKSIIITNTSGAGKRQ